MYSRTIILITIFAFCILPCHFLQCGYKSCPKPKEGVYNIHIVAHTHDDVGWLKTKDQYFYGQNMSIQEAGVQYIIDTVVDALLENPQRRFIYVETAFFWMWWTEQTPEKQQIVRELVNSGRLEIIGGAWSMNDEAAAHYHSIVDQFTWGFRRLNESLGECGRPKIGWQIDPFGHSRENAAIMAKMGFDGLFLGRIDYQDKIFRMFDKAYEMMWHTSHNDISEASKLFTSVLFNTYSPPPGFCFDVHCQDSPIVDNVKSPEYNVPERVGTFLKYMVDYSLAYRTKNILVTMGNDFNYQDASMNFKNMDKLIKYINENELDGGKFHAFYSTPSCYLRAVNKADVELPVKADDFFPYASDEESYWTGYFTSRPTQKRFERMGNNFLQVGKQILALSNMPLIIDITEAKEAMGVMQHHDAITGTEKQHVASDYARLLTRAMKTLERNSAIGLSKLINSGLVNQRTPQQLKFKSCLLLNVSSCPETETGNSFVVTIYNPLSRYVDKLVRLPVARNDLIYIVHGPAGQKIPVQLVPLPKYTHLPGRKTNASSVIAFIAERVPPLGFKSYYVESSTIKHHHQFFKSEVFKITEAKKIGYSLGPELFLNSAGQLISMKKRNSVRNFPFKQNFFYYRGAVGNNDLPSGGERSSGAYIFRPNGTEQMITDKPHVTVVTGPVVSEIQQQFCDWVSQVIRVHNKAEHVEFQWSVGPIPYENSDGSRSGKEVITRYSTGNLHNNGVFYTDSNGREMLRRQLNYRPTWKVSLLEKISGNYYPVTTNININDNSDPPHRLSVVTDRSEGGTSLNDGEIELMLHRRLLHDDAFGVGEALNETAFNEPLVAVGSHYVTTEGSNKVRMLVQDKVLDSWIFISPTQGLLYQEWKNEYTMEFSGLKRALPNNVQILTLERWMEIGNIKTYLLRLENIMEERDDPTIAEINIKDLFSTFSVTNIKEMMLGGNIPVNKSRRLKWGIYKRISDTDREEYYRISSNIITLKPMEIRTFLVEIEPFLLNNFNTSKDLYETVQI